MGTRFDVSVVPRASNPGPAGRHGGLPRLRVAAPPEAGRANAEVEHVLGGLLGVRVRVVGGAKARTKTVEAELDGDELARRLDGAFGTA